MTVVLPANRKWVSVTSTDVAGAVVQTKNMDFDTEGYLAVAKKALTLYSEADDSDFKTIIAIGADSTFLYVLTESNFFFITLSSLTVAKNLAGTGIPSLGFNSDLVSFNSFPHVSGTQTVAKFDVTQVGLFPWTQEISGLSSSYPHPMAKMENRQTLLVGDGNVVHQYDTSYVEDTTNKLTLPVEYVVVRIIYRGSYAYLLTRNVKGGNAKLFVWNATGTGHNGAYGVDADWIYSGCEYGSYVAVVTSAGQLLEFNGAGFSELQHLPVYYAGVPWTSSNAIANLIGNVASRGMEAIGTTIYLNVNAQLPLGQASPSGTYLATMPSGLWTFDPTSGLRHSAGANYADHLTLSPTEIDSNAMVFATAHQAQTGDAVLCFAKSGITNLRAGQTYYAIYVGDNAVQLALSPASAKAGKAVTLTGTPNSGDVFKLDSYSTFGAGQITNTGAVFVLKGLLPNEFLGSRILFGQRVLDHTLASKGVLASLGLGRNRGYFVTGKMGAGGIQDTFQKLFAKFPQLNLDSEEIVAKYRIAQRFGLPCHTAFNSVGGTFTSATTLTVDPTQKDLASALAGDEIEFIAGAASGYLAHIVSIDTSNPASYVITVDEALPVTANDTTDFIIDNWTKFTPLTNLSATNTQSFSEQGIGKPSTWVEFKVELRGRGTCVEQLLLTNATHKLPS